MNRKILCFPSYTIGSLLGGLGNATGSHQHQWLSEVS